MTPSQFAALPEGDQLWMLAYEVYRQRQIEEWRAQLVGDGGKDNKQSPEVATMLKLAGL